jgi:hypothetical protein
VPDFVIFNRPKLNGHTPVLQWFDYFLGIGTAEDKIHSIMYILYFLEQQILGSFAHPVALIENEDFVPCEPRVTMEIIFEIAHEINAGEVGIIEFKEVGVARCHDSFALIAFTTRHPGWTMLTQETHANHPGTGRFARSRRTMKKVRMAESALFKVVADYLFYFFLTV